MARRRRRAAPRSVAFPVSVLPSLFSLGGFGHTASASGLGGLVAWLLVCVLSRFFGVGHAVPVVVAPVAPPAVVVPVAPVPPPAAPPVNRQGVEPGNDGPACLRFWACGWV